MKLEKGDIRVNRFFVVFMIILKSNRPVSLVCWALLIYYSYIQIKMENFMWVFPSTQSHVTMPTGEQNKMNVHLKILNALDS